MELIPTEENMIWVPLEVINESVSMSNFLNADLRSLLGIFDWDLFMFDKSTFNVADQHNQMMDSLLKKNIAGTSKLEIVPIDKLNKWKLTKTGIMDIANTGLAVDIYDINCANREINSWIQPLMKSDGKGSVILYTRMINDQVEVLLSVRSEIGISGRYSILPSFVSYPGEKSVNIPSWVDESEELVSFIQSDEGGRFYRHESIYKLIQVMEDVEVMDDQFWVSLPFFKQLLKTSNLVSFQLRCISSVLLELINPMYLSGKR
jgi:oxidase EvaA